MYLAVPISGRFQEFFLKYLRFLPPHRTHSCHSSPHHTLAYQSFVSKAGFTSEREHGIRKRCEHSMWTCYRGEANSIRLCDERSANSRMLSVDCRYIEGNPCTIRCVHICMRTQTKRGMRERTNMRQNVVVRRASEWGSISAYISTFENEILFEVPTPGG